MESLILASFCFSFLFSFQDGEIDLKPLTKVLSPETEVFEVSLYDNNYARFFRKDSVCQFQYLVACVARVRKRGFRRAKSRGAREEEGKRRTVFVVTVVQLKCKVSSDTGRGIVYWFLSYVVLRFNRRQT